MDKEKFRRDILTLKNTRKRKEKAKEKQGDNDVAGLVRDVVRNMSK